MKNILKWYKLKFVSKFLAATVLGKISASGHEGSVPVRVLIRIARKGGGGKLVLHCFMSMVVEVCTDFRQVSIDAVV